MQQTIFDKLSIDRQEVHWEDYLGALTPVENHQGVYFKRMDYWAPFGYGGPNGMKLAQLVWYVNKFRQGKTHIVTGASIQSPQLSMSAIVGYHYGLPAREVVYSKPKTILTHPNPKIAAGFGAKFEYCNGPYNPIIQKKVADLTQENSLVVHYGITTPLDLFEDEDVRKFHEVGAFQTQNIPAEVRTLYIPSGSCNSLTSIMLGLSRNPHNIKKVVLMEIGPDKKKWVKERLDRIGVNVNTLPFEVAYHQVVGKATGVTYSDKHWEEFDGIEFHPTYEGKVWRYLKERDMLNYDGTEMFWIIGSWPHEKVVEPFYPLAA